MSDIFDHEGDAWESLEPLGGPDNYYSGIAGGVFSKSYGGSSYRSGNKHRRGYNWSNYVPFTPDPLYYHMRLDNPTIVRESVNGILFSFNGHELWVPRKVIRFKGREIYVHTNTLAKIIRDYRKKIMSK